MAKDDFRKSDVYDALQGEDRTFIGRVIGILLQEGYLSQRGPKTRPVYIWAGKKEDFDPGRWIDRRVLTATVKKSPTTDRPRERLLRLGAAELKAAELFAILIRSGVQGESAIQAGEKLSALFGTDLEELSLKSRGELKREVLMYFDAIKMGLTATPAAHTTAFFKKIVYAYDYERAVREGFLVDYDAVAVQSA